MLNTVVNYLGIQMTARINQVMLVGELIVLAIFLVIGVVALAAGQGPRASRWSRCSTADTFSWSLVFGAVSIAVLSFLGFDGISMLAEESREGAAPDRPGDGRRAALAGVLFIVQTWVAALLVPDPAEPAGQRRPGGHRVLRRGPGRRRRLAGTLTAVATAIAWGFANSLVAQAATSRLLYAMARDRQLPRFLAKINRPAQGAGQRHPRWSRPSRWRSASTWPAATTASRCCPRWSTSAR